MHFTSSNVLQIRLLAAYLRTAYVEAVQETYRAPKALSSPMVHVYL